MSFLTYLTYILIAISITMSTISLVIAFRNMRLFKYRARVLEKISLAKRREIWDNIPTTLDFQILDDVPYMEMVWKFWRSFDSFFPEEYRP